jgi:hypothetical protein
MRMVGRALLAGSLLATGLAACDSTRPLVFTGFLANHDPVVVQSLQAFPTTIGDGDSAIVSCFATDADGDTIRYDWFSDCTLKLKGAFGNDYFVNNTAEGKMIVYPGCVTGASDTGRVSCSVRDLRGGGAYAGYVDIIVQHGSP